MKRRLRTLILTVKKVLLLTIDVEIAAELL